MHGAKSIATSLQLYLESLSELCMKFKVAIVWHSNNNSDVQCPITTYAFVVIMDVFMNENQFIHFLFVQIVMIII